MNILRYLLQPYSVFVLISSFVVLIVPISLIALPFSQPVRLRLTSPFWILFGKISLHLVCFTKLSVIDERPKEIQKMGIPPGLYIANHQSFMDIPVLLTQFTVPPIMKKEVLYIPVFGLCGYSAGALIVDRGKNNSRKRVLEAAKYRMQHGHANLQYYPEGTRQKDDHRPKSYDKIKKPLMKYAYELNIPVYACSIFGTRRILNKKDGTANYGVKVGLKLHDGVNPADYPDVDQFMQKCWKNVTDGYDELAAKLS
jgi:1-acyl-sn-glycerol-3-phosphate acyltransferase